MTGPFGIICQGFLSKSYVTPVGLVINDTGEALFEAFVQDRSAISSRRTSNSLSSYWSNELL